MLAHSPDFDDQHRRVRFTEPVPVNLPGVGSLLVAAGIEGVVAERWPTEPEGTFAVIVDAPNWPTIHMARVPMVVERQVREMRR